MTFSFFSFFFTCVTNLIQMIFKYELRFAAITWPSLYLSGICKLKPKKTEKLKKTKNLKKCLKAGFYQPWLMR